MKTDSNREVAWMRLLTAALLLLFSCAAGYYLQPFISGNKDAINVIVTVFSILAGFLIAVITFIGDPGSRGWKELQNDKRAVKARLRRHSSLFYLYLVTLGLALSLFLLPEAWLVTHLWLERLFTGSAVFVFLASFSLPGSLMELQMDKYVNAIDEKVPDALKKNTDNNIR